MTITLADRWDIVTLTKAINNIPKPPTLFGDLVYKNKANHGVQNIIADIMVGTSAMSPMRRAESPYVNIAKRGRAAQQITMVPHCKDQIMYDPEKEAAIALPGNTMMLQEGQVNDTQAYLINEYQETLVNSIAFRWEWLFAQQLLYGVITYLADDGSLNYQLNVNAPGTHVFFEDAADLWSAGTSNPITQLRQYQTTVMQDGRVRVPLCVMGSDAVNAFFAHDAVIEYAKSNQIQFGNIKSEPVSDVVRTISENFLGMKIVEYLGMYAADGTGTMTPYMDPDRVLLIGDDPNNDTFQRHYVDIHDITGNIRTEIFSYIYTDLDKRVQYVRADSAMIPWVTNANRFLSVDVMKTS